MRLDALRYCSLGFVFAALLLAGCDSRKSKAPEGDAPEGASAQDASAGLSAADRAAIDELLSGLNRKTRRFEYAQVTKAQNARLFVHLARTTTDPVVAAAALRALPTSLAKKESAKELPQEDLERALLKHLDSKEAEVLAAALTAAPIALLQGKGSSALSSRLLQLAQGDRPAPERAAALEALAAARLRPRPAEFTAAFTAALAAKEPHLVAIGLRSLAKGNASFPPGSPEHARLVELTGHTDPGIRGEALRLLALSRNAVDAAVLEKLQGALRDEHAFVRAQACEALARVGEKSTIHALAPLLDDEAPSRYDLSGWTRVDGRPGVLRHRMRGRKLVRDSAAYAIAELSGEELASAATPEPPGKVDGKKKVDAKKKAKTPDAAAVKAWYQRARSRIPAASTPSVAAKP